MTESRTALCVLTRKKILVEIQIKSYDYHPAKFPSGIHRFSAYFVQGGFWENSNYGHNKSSEYRISMEISDFGRFFDKKVKCRECKWPF